MIKCPKCGKEYRDDAVFCTDCGIRLHEQYTAPNTDAGADSDQHTYTAPTGEAYHNSAPSAPGAPSDGRVLSMWDYFLMELVTKVPILRIVMYCGWGFSADTNENRKNWSRAQLIWLAVGIVFTVAGIALAALLAGTTTAIFSRISDYMHYLAARLSCTENKKQHSGASECC